MTGGLEPTAAGPVTREQIRCYADAVDDHNPMHVDEDFAKAAGMPSVIAHGPLTLMLAIDALVGAHGPNALESFDGRLRAPLLPGQRLTVAARDGELELRTDDGATVIASASIDLRGGS